MTDNPDILAARSKAELANQANETKTPTKWSDTAPDYDPRPENKPAHQGLGYVPGGADLQRDDTITAAVPDWLVPAACKAAAFKWNTLDERLDKAEDELTAARSAAANAPGEDRKARKDALAAGKRFSGQPAQDKAAERIREATENMRTLNELTREAAKALITSLRANRAEVVRLTRERLTPAIATAREAAAQAEAAVRTAAAEVAEANSGLALVEGLDSNASDWIGAFVADIPTPDFTKYKHTLNTLESNAEVIETPLEPTRVTVRTANGIQMDVAPHVAAILIGQGAEEIHVYEGVSGLPAAQRGTESLQHLRKTNS